jgi:hypothetical protein
MQSLSETLNGLAQLAYPERYGDVGAADLPTLHEHILHVLGASELLWMAPTQLRLDMLREMLPEIETAIAQAAGSPEHRASAALLAREYIDAIDLSAFGNV